MLEIPEAFVLSKQLEHELLGSHVTHVVANASPHKLAWYFEDPADYPARLQNLKVTGITPLAGQIQMTFEHMRLTFSDGVNARIYDSADQLPDKHQMRIDFDHGKTLICTVQMYGGLMAFEKDENQNPYYLVAGSKPSPLTDAFDFKYFMALIAKETKNPSIKALLATEQRIPGIGNGVLQDILYNANIHPKRKLKSLNDDEVHTLFNSIKETLNEMTRLGGRDTEKDIYGHSGGYATKLCSKTQNLPCHKCGDILHKENYLGGSIYYCATCQPLELR